MGSRRDRTLEPHGGISIRRLNRRQALRAVGLISFANWPGCFVRRFIVMLIARMSEWGGRVVGFQPLSRSTACLLLLLLGGCAGGSTDTRPGAATNSPSTTAVGTATGLYTMGGVAVHLDCQGAGQPVVVLIAGGFDPTTAWDGLRSKLPSTMHTCAFDRPGVGASQTPAQPLTAGLIASTLFSTLRAAGVAPPYVLAAHSIGALSVLAYVGRYPQDVGGVVLFDPTTAPYFAAHSDEFNLGWDNAATIAELRSVASWPAIPTRILSSDPALRMQLGATAADEREWQADQRLLATFAHGSYQEVRGAGHYIYRDQPATAVSALTGVISSIR